MECSSAMELPTTSAAGLADLELLAKRSSLFTYRQSHQNIQKPMENDIVTNRVPVLKYLDNFVGEKKVISWQKLQISSEYKQLCGIFEKDSLPHLRL